MNSLMKIVCLLAFVFVFAANASSVQNTPSAESEQIVVSACTRCHSPARICKNLGRGFGFWEDTVNWMKRKGAKVEGQQIKPLAGYFSSLAPGASIVCK